MVGSPGPAAILYGDLEQRAAGGRGSEAGSGEAAAGRLLADKAGGVIVPGAWVEVGRGKQLSQFVHRHAVSVVRVGDRDRPCSLAREPVRRRPAWEGRLAALPCLGPKEACPDRPARCSLCCHACRGGWFASPTIPPDGASRGRDAISISCGMISCHLMYDSLCPVRLTEMLSFTWILFLTPVLEVSQRTH